MIYLRKKIDGKKAIIGFANSGVVGSVCADYIAKELEMEYIGTVLDIDMDAVCIATEKDNVTLRNMVRIYSSNERDFISVVCDMNFSYSPNYCYKFADALIELIMENDISEVLMIDSRLRRNMVTGVTPISHDIDSNFDYRISISSSTKTLDEMKNISEKYGCELFKHGIVVGVNAALLNLLHVNNVDNLIVVTDVPNLIDIDISAYIDTIRFITTYLGVEESEISMDVLETRYNEFMDNFNKFKKEIISNMNMNTDKYIA